MGILTVIFGPEFHIDLARVNAHSTRFGIVGRPYLREQSIWAIAVYRFGRRNDQRSPGPLRWFLNQLYRVIYKIIETLTGISIPKSVCIGPGLMILHFGNIVINSHCTIGANCTIRHGITIGDRGGGIPIIEDDVDIGAHAQILGGIRIGQGAKIGAMSLVICDVPPGATAVGVPARIILRIKESSHDSATI